MLVCDVPAKSWVLGTKGHNGFYSCSKCQIMGQTCKEGSKKKTVYFPGKSAPKRTDEDFKSYKYRGTYQIKDTIFNEVPQFGCVSNVPLDYMHLVCLGVTKKLLLAWLKGSKKVRLSKNSRIELTNRILDFYKHIPRDFSTRRPKKIKHILKTWKAHDYRQFLLYFGPVVLKDLLPKELYDHFLLLHVAISILANPSLSQDESFQDHAQKLLEKFVRDAEKHYSITFMSHNVHNLLHLVDDVKKYGALDVFGAFKFENFIGRVKKYVRKAELPLQQISRRLEELKNLKQSKSNKNAANVFSRTEKVCCAYGGENFVESAMMLKTQNSIIICADNCNDVIVLDSGNVLRCNEFRKNINNEWYVIGNLYANKHDLYTNSKSLHINFVDGQLEDEEKIYSINCIMAKACKLPFEKKFAIVPIIHTYNTFRN